MGEHRDCHRRSHLCALARRSDPGRYPLAGLVDDAAVIALVVVCVSTELLKFREWEVRQQAA
jgi:hypothetical protein